MRTNRVMVYRERGIPVGDSWRKLKRKEAEVEKLREALRYYTMPANGADGGKRAKAALGEGT